MYGGSAYQPELERNPITQSIAHIEQRVADAKGTIEDILYILDMQGKASWPEVLEKFSSLAAAMTHLQSALKKSALPNMREDNGAILRSNVIVPQHLSLEPDQILQNLTLGRVHSFNHDLVPDYLRTKGTPDLEMEEQSIENERNAKGPDVVAKQITNLNKHAELLLATITGGEKSAAEGAHDAPTFSKEETIKLVKAINTGEHLKASRGAASIQPDASAGAAARPGMPQAHMMPAMQQGMQPMYHMPPQMQGGMAMAANPQMAGHPMMMQMKRPM